MGGLRRPGRSRRDAERVPSWGERKKTHALNDVTEVREALKD